MPDHLVPFTGILLILMTASEVGFFLSLKRNKLRHREVKKCSWSHSYEVAEPIFEPRQQVQMVKNPPAMRETWVRSLGREDPLEKGMATHSSILAWGIPRTEEPAGLQSMGSQRVGHN